MTKSFKIKIIFSVIIILAITPANIYPNRIKKQHNIKKQANIKNEGHTQKADSRSTIYIIAGGGYNYPDGTVTGNGDQERIKQHTYNLGLAYEYSFHQNWAFNLGIGYYNKKFSVSKNYNSYDLEYKVTGKFLGLSTELLFLYKYFYFSMGFFYGHKIGNEKQEVDYVSDFDLNYEYENYEYGLSASPGLKFNINDTLVAKMGVRIDYSLTSIYQNEFDDKINNISAKLEFAVGYRL